MLATLETPKKATLLRWSSETIFINFQIACSKLGVGSDIFFGLYSSSHMLTYCTLAKQTATNSQHSGYTQLKHATPGKIKSVRGFAWKGLRSGISAFWWPFVPHNHLKTRIRCQIYQPTHMQCLHASFYWQTNATPNGQVSRGFLLLPQTWSKASTMPEAGRMPFSGLS